MTGWSRKGEVSFAGSLKLCASVRLSPWVLASKPLKGGFPITDPVMWRIFPSPYYLKDSNTSVLNFRHASQIIPVIWYQHPERRKKHLDKVQNSSSSCTIVSESSSQHFDSLSSTLNPVLERHTCELANVISSSTSSIWIPRRTSGIIALSPYSSQRFADKLFSCCLQPLQKMVAQWPNT